jgi:hypothetical protein
MAKKLALDVSSLEVATFDLGEADGLQGTVQAHEQVIGPGPVTRTNCLTTPCCAPSVTCPTPTVFCA